MYVDGSNGRCEELGRCVVQDGVQGSLQYRTATDDPLTETLQSFAHLQGQDIVAVVDHDPAHPPARNQVPNQSSSNKSKIYKHFY